MRLPVLLLAATLVGSAALAAGQKDSPKAKAIQVTAQELAKECAADSTKATAKYKGKTLRVTGKVGDVYDELLYLPVKGAGQLSSVVIRFKGNKPDVKKGDTATFEGKFDLVAVLGPALVDCKLVTDKGKD
jgi:putative nucleic acid binding protein